MKPSKHDFVRGYICACCGILDGHGVSTEIREALDAIGFHRLDLRILDVADREILKKWGFLPRKRRRNDYASKKRGSRRFTGHEPKTPRES